MRYLDHKHHIRTGDLLVWSNVPVGGSSKFIGSAIRLFTMSEYCHVGIAWVIGKRVFVVEAVPPSIRIYPLSKLIPFYHVKMSLAPNEADVEALISRVGESYSRIQAIMSYFKAPTPDNEWQCVEYAKDFYKRFDLEFGDVWTPSDFVESVLSKSSDDRPYYLQLVDQN